jgi:hypothetical protein
VCVSTSCKYPVLILCITVCFFYRCLEYRSCPAVCWQMQAFYAVKLLRSVQRYKKDPVQQCELHVAVISQPSSYICRVCILFDNRRLSLSVAVRPCVWESDEWATISGTTESIKWQSADETVALCGATRDIQLSGRTHRSTVRPTDCWVDIRCS